MNNGTFTINHSDSITIVIGAGGVCIIQYLGIVE